MSYGAAAYDAERDARIGNLEELPRRSIQARRGLTTRQMLAELRKAFDAEDATAAREARASIEAGEPLIPWSRSSPILRGVIPQPNAATTFPQHGGVPALQQQPYPQVPPRHLVDADSKVAAGMREDEGTFTSQDEQAPA